jgi:DNA-binding response OmpR family regulator
MSVLNSRNSKQTSDLLEQIRDLARRHRTLLSRLGSAELLADTISLDLSRIENCLETGELEPVAEDEKHTGPKGGGRSREQLRILADSGVTTLEINLRSDGLSDVRIDAGKKFNLPPALADLLSILSLNGGTSDDRLVGWKTIDEVAILLGKRSSRRFSRHTVTQSIYRLRKELFNRGGANPYLIQTNRRRGVRFALKQKGRSIESD